MSKIVHTLCLILVCGISLTAIAEGSDDVARGVKSRMVTIEVSIVELAEKPNPDEKLDPQTSQALVSRIRELETQGKLSGLTRIRLSTLEGSEASAQTSERVAVTTGRTALSGRPGREGQIATQLQYQNFGTLVRAVSRIEPGDSIVLDLQIEKTSLLRQPRPADAENVALDGVTMGGFATTEFKSSVSIPNGQTIVVQSTGSSSTTDAPKRVVILVTADAEQTPQVSILPAVQPEEEHALTVFELRSVKVDEMRDVIQEMLPHELISMASDVRTNKLLVRASPKHTKIIEGILSILDKEPTKTQEKRDTPLK